MSTMERITEAAGWDAAIEVVGYWGGREIDVPDSIDPDHELSKIIGHDAATRLVAEFGGETLEIPAATSRINDLHKAGIAKALHRHGVPVRLIALALKVGRKRAEQYLEGLHRDDWQSSR